MIANVGNPDRLLRLVLGAVLIALPFVAAVPLLQEPVVRWGMMLVGAILVLTAAVGFCPLYRLIGFATRRT